MYTERQALPRVEGRQNPCCVPKTHFFTSERMDTIDMFTVSERVTCVELVLILCVW